MAKRRARHDSGREAFWRRVVARQERSGLGVRAFCRQAQLSEPSFYAWRRVIRERDARPERAAAFVPLVVREQAGSADGGRIAIEWRGGRVLRLPATIAAERMAELVRALESVPQAASGATTNGRTTPAAAAKRS